MKLLEVSLVVVVLASACSSHASNDYGYLSQYGHGYNNYELNHKGHAISHSSIVQTHPASVHRHHGHADHWGYVDHGHDHYSHHGHDHHAVSHTNLVQTHPVTHKHHNHHDLGHYDYYGNSGHHGHSYGSYGHGGHAVSQTNVIQTHGHDLGLYGHGTHGGHAVSHSKLVQTHPASYKKYDHGHSGRYSNLRLHEHHPVGHVGSHLTVLEHPVEYISDYVEPYGYDSYGYGDLGYWGE